MCINGGRNRWSALTTCYHPGDDFPSLVKYTTLCRDGNKTAVTARRYFTKLRSNGATSRPFPDQPVNTLLCVSTQSTKQPGPFRLRPVRHLTASVFARHQYPNILSGYA
jgi:hypothetical protein